MVVGVTLLKYQATCKDKGTQISLLRMSCRLLIRFKAFFVLSQLKSVSVHSWFIRVLEIFESFGFFFFN